MRKRAIISKYSQDIRASYWFLPTALALVAVGLSHIALHLDHTQVLLPDRLRTTQVEGARAILALISQSMIGVAGVMFSITIVAVSFASGNFGPRLIGNFMRDRGNQWCLGILISTFVYTLLILRAVQSPYGPEGDGAAFVPHLAMLIALGFAGVSVMSMIYFVHHIPEIINVSNISAGLGRRLRVSLEEEFTAQIKTEDIDHPSFPDRTANCQIKLAGAGFIQTWNRDRLKELAEEHDLFVNVKYSAGDFVSAQTPILEIWAPDDLPDDVKDALRDCFALGTIPTEPQNPMFIVDQLVEMVARAMSPGVNDPFTAINCINWLYVGLGAAAQFDGANTPEIYGRVRYPRISFEGLLAASFGNLAPYVRGDAIALAHVLTTLRRLADETPHQSARTQLEQMIDHIERARTTPPPQ